VRKRIDQDSLRSPIPFGFAAIPLWNNVRVGQRVSAVQDLSGSI
jgi:hypothetical protein